MKIYLIGSTGQVGTALNEMFPDADIRRFDLVHEIAHACNYIKKENFDYVINAAAFTRVDAAEDRGSGRALSCILNAYLPQELAKVCDASETRLMHISTDYIFDGAKTTPYVETDRAYPKSVYGMHKLEAEKLIQTALRQHYILRTSWIYSPIRTNFVKTMLQLGKQHQKLSVVDDQVGCPTSARQIAQAIHDIIVSEREDYGIYNFTASGSTSWFDFAQAIFEAVRNIDVNYPIPEVVPICTKNYSKSETAPRPANSVLDCSKIQKIFEITQTPWQQELPGVITKLLQSNNE